MSPRVDLEELVTGAEIGRRIGVSTSRLHQLREQDGFPEPLGKVGKAIVWRWADIQKWAHRTGRPID